MSNEGPSDDSFGGRLPLIPARIERSRVFLIKKASIRHLSRLDALQI
jgi:hypothetical protein